jgi:hypothetical protein
MPLIEKSHVVYSKFYTRSRRNVGGVGGGMDPIDLAKDRDTWCVARSLNYDSWSHFSLPLDVFYHL